MFRLRRLAILPRCMLVWFLLSLGVAVAAPMVHPQAFELICSAAGTVKTIVHTDDGAQEVEASTAADCPLCLLPAAPPAAQGLSHIAMPLPLGRALQSIPAARLAAATAAPLPARGPPVIS